MTAFFLMLFWIGCANRHDLVATENTSASVKNVFSPIDSNLSSDLYFKVGLDAMANEDWLGAQSSLDQALSALMAEDSAGTLDSSLVHEKTMRITAALETVYPHLSSLAQVDSALAQEEDDSMAPEDSDADADSDAALVDALDEGPLDSSDLQILHHALDSTDRSQFSLPVEFNERVLREIHFMSRMVSDFTGGSLSRMSIYEDMIRAKLRERNMPEDLLYLAFVESGFKVHAFSRAKASGLWQFIAATGRRYGLQVDFWVDMRRNPDMATDAALDYLEDLHKEFGDWLLAMAAYNCGEGRIRRLLREGDSLTYWDLKLPKETMHYVPRILASMVIGHNPAAYGFTPETLSVALVPFDTVTVTDCVPIQNIAKASGTDASTIRELNKELNRWCTPPNKHAYLLRIPQGSRDKFVQAYAKMDKSKFARWYRHRIRYGENLGTIARAYGLSIAALRDVNGLKSNRIRAGKTLLIPLPSGSLPPEAEDPAGKGSPSGKASTNASQYKVRRGDNLASIARRYGTSANDLIAWNNLTGTQIIVGQWLQVRPPRENASTPVKKTVTSKIKDSGKTYVVKSGDSYYSIAMATGVSMTDLMDLNDAHNSRLALGQTLKLPVAVASPVSSTPSRSALVQGNSNDLPSGWYEVRSGDNLFAISKRFQVTVNDLLQWNGLDNSVVKPGQRIRVRQSSQVKTGAFHMVQKGDTLWDIARKYGVSIQQIMEWNSLSDGKVMPGTRLRVGL
ncbi:MAG TPA: LysM peptidoglycan-binding domain-containing protein [Fibrobacteraceae bacterium]|nr:LysM peptidoglycan-binding domain-containing protein [Fibrobacteraceae bacterium]